jgi:ABC-type amino acid transport substrate-binding protein
MKNVKFLIVTFFLTTFVTLTLHAQKTLERIEKNGELRVGMTASQPPYTMKANDGSVIGYEVDLATMFAESMGAKLTIVEKPFNQLLDALQKGEVDIVMSGMTMTMPRNKIVAFAGPYFLTGKSILTKSPDLSDTDESSDLNKNTLTLTVLKGSTSEDYVRKEIPEAELILAESYNDGIKAVEEGRASIMVADYSICAYTALVHPEKGLITIDEPLTIEPIGMAMPPNDAHFHNIVNNYLNALSLVGALDILEKKWFDSGEWVPLVK